MESIIKPPAWLNSQVEWQLNPSLSQPAKWLLLKNTQKKRKKRENLHLVNIDCPWALKSHSPPPSVWVKHDASSVLFPTSTSCECSCVARLQSSISFPPHSILRWTDLSNFQTRTLIRNNNVWFKGTIIGDLLPPSATPDSWYWITSSFAPLIQNLKEEKKEIRCCHLINVSVLVVCSCIKHKKILRHYSVSYMLT